MIESMLAGTALLRHAFELSRQNHFRELVALVAPLGDDELVAEPELGCLLARAWTWTGSPQRALALLDRIARAHDGANDAIHRMRLNQTANALYLLGRMEPAEREWTALLLAATQAEDHRRVSEASNSLGLIALVQGRYPEAMALFERSAAAAQHCGDPLPLAMAYLNRSTCCRALGLLDDSLTLADRALALAQGLDIPLLEATVEAYRARIFLRRGDLRLAEAAAAGARRRLESEQNPGHVTESLRDIGDIRVAQGRYEEGVELLEQALRLSRRERQRLVEVQVLEDLAVAYTFAGQNRAAADTEAEAIRQLEALGAPRRVARLRHALADAAAPRPAPWPGAPAGSSASRPAGTEEEQAPDRGAAPPFRFSDRRRE